MRNYTYIALNYKTSLDTQVAYRPVLEKLEKYISQFPGCWTLEVWTDRLSGSKKAAGSPLVVLRNQNGDIPLKKRNGEDTLEGISMFRLLAQFEAGWIPSIQ